MWPILIFAVVLIGSLAALYLYSNPEAARALQDAYEDFAGSPALAETTPTATPTPIASPSPMPSPTPTVGFPYYLTPESLQTIPVPRAIVPPIAAPTTTLAIAPIPPTYTPTPAVFFPPTVTPTPTPATPVPTPTRAPTYTPTPTPVPLNANTIERLVLELTNEARIEHGLPPFEHDPELAKIARAHSETMVVAGYTHYVFGLTPTDRAKAANYPCYGIAENIHMVSEVTMWLVWPSGLRVPSKTRSTQEIAATLVDEWMDSSGHRANILDPTLYKIGVGIALSPDRPPLGSGHVFATQNFSPCL